MSSIDHNDALQNALKKIGYQVTNGISHCRGPLCAPLFLSMAAPHVIAGSCFQAVLQPTYTGRPPQEAFLGHTQVML